jgi:hypothetical protein
MNHPVGYGTVTPEALDHLQRVGAAPLTHEAADVTSAPPALRRLVRFAGVAGRAKPGPPVPGEPAPAATQALLAGLASYRIPVVFALEGTPGGCAVRIGTWSAAGREDARPAVLDGRLSVIDRLLRLAWPEVDLAPQEPQWPGDAWPRAALVLGTPGQSRPDPLDGANAVDRLVRAMAGQRWAALTLAEPVGPAVLAAQRHRAIDAIRKVSAAGAATGVPQPLAEAYGRLLSDVVAALTEAQAVGGWRTATYLLGDEVSYPALAAAWQGLFAVDGPEPVQVFEGPAAAHLASGWGMPDLAGDGGPLATGTPSYRHPYRCQSLLTSTQLAAMVDVPRLERPGFAVSISPVFDAVPPAVGDPVGGTVEVGAVVHAARPTGAAYRVSTGSLTRHAFIAGVTGAGKTNTLFHLLDQLDQAGVPFLVVEPAKTEYRQLLAHPRLGRRLRVFTPGEESVSPLRLNPFEVMPGATVSAHLDLLRAAFAASFGMWTPLPQVLERCLHEVYADRGWDLRTNTNQRLDGQAPPALAWPTLTDLVAKVDEVVPLLGYEPRITDDIRAALVTRLESLRAGGKGAMLDVATSLPASLLFDGPTVVELEAVAADDDKAFLMGLLLILLAQHRQAAGPAGGLAHLLVIEEAHRLLANVARSAVPEVADPRGQAVETFTNLISEVRAYGQAVVVADQVPVRLAPDVIKNTSLKIAHRVVAADDRAALAGSMAMDDSQERALTVLRPGQAATFSDGADAPLLVQVPLVKDLDEQVVDAPAVAGHMARWRQDAGPAAAGHPQPSCAETCAGAPSACAAARLLVSEDAVRAALARTVLSTIEHPGALDRMWPDLLSTIDARRPASVDRAALLRAVAGHAADWYARRRGAQGNWSYPDTERLSELLRAALVEKAAAGSADLAASPARQAFQVEAQRLHQRAYSPYAYCDRICDQRPPLCLYRWAAADLVATGRYRAAWQHAEAGDLAVEGDRRTRTWDTCQDGGYELIEFPEDDWPDERRVTVSTAARRACLCFAQQMLVDDTRKIPRTARRVMIRILDEAGA